MLCFIEYIQVMSQEYRDKRVSENRQRIADALEAEFDCHVTHLTGKTLVFYEEGEVPLVLETRHRSVQYPPDLDKMDRMMLGRRVNRTLREQNIEPYW